jgi:hypothetical protein
LNNFEFKANFYVVNMGDIDMVLGMKWLHDIREFTLNLCEMEKRFKMDGRTHVLKAIKDTSCKMISFKRMERLMCHDRIEWAVECVLMLAQGEQQKLDYHPNIQELRIQHTKVFSDIPPSRPLDREIEHIIELEEGAKPMIITSNRHPK